MQRLIKKYLLVGLIFSSLLSGAQINKKPNLVFLLADQLRYDALACNGNTKAVTPNIDNFAEEAISFTNAVSVTPVCAPYRASLLTGKYTSSTGMVINEINFNPNNRTIAHILTDAGYDLGYVGKMHLNDRHKRPYKKGVERLGFDDYWAGYSFNHMSYKSFYYTDTPTKNDTLIDLMGKYGPEEFTSLAIDYIKTASSAEKPFALFLSWNPPHDPWLKSNVPEHCYSKFKNETFELPPNFKAKPDKYMDRFPGKFFEGNAQWKDEFLNEGGYQEIMRNYYAMVNSIDEQFGRLNDLLKKLGIDDNTVVVFTSDHGEMFTSQGRMYKLTFYDEAARIPLLIKYPEQPNIKQSDVCINTPDLLPTILGMLGLENMISEEIEGININNVLNGKSELEPEVAFMQGMGHTWQWIDGFEWRAVRGKRFTYAKYLKDGAEVLYDRELDPYQKSNEIANPVYAQELKRLKRLMNDKMSSLNDNFKPCTWYRDNWMDKIYSIKSAAKGDFGPLPPITPERTIH